MTSPQGSTPEQEQELAQAMDWTAHGVQALCTASELTGALLHLIGAGGDVDVVFLPEAPPLVLHTARALIVVRQPHLATLALEGWAAEIDERRVRDDPLLRDWWRRRQCGEEARVAELPADYIMEILIIAGESARGARALRTWRIGGTPGEGARGRTFTPRPLAEGTVGTASLHPLFMQELAAQSGIDPDALRRKAELYLAHTHYFEEVYSREKDQER